MYETSVLTNGVRVCSAPMPHTRTVSVGLFVGAGSRYEVDAMAGASHYLEHMLFKATERRPSPELISGPIESVGGVINAFTDRELTCYWIKVASEHFGLAMDLLADMVCNATLPLGECERERQVILEELSMTNDHPDTRVELLVDAALWPDQPLGRDVGGSKESVSAISRDDLLTYRNRQYVANNIVLAAAGDVTSDAVMEAGERGLIGLRQGDPSDWLPREERCGATAVLEYRKTDQTHLAMALPGVSQTDSNRYPLDILNVVLGEGMTSRLWMELRERQGLSYDIHSSVSHLRDCGSLNVHCGTDPRKLGTAVSAILRELERMARDGASEAEVERATRSKTGRMFLQMEDTRAVMSSMGAQAILHGRVRTPDEIVEEIRAVALEEVNAVARRYLDPAALKLAVVGPHRSSAQLHRLLALA